MGAYTALMEQEGASGNIKGFAPPVCFKPTSVLCFRTLGQRQPVYLKKWETEQGAWKEAKILSAYSQKYL